MMGDIQIRLKFNIILNPANQQRPPNATEYQITNCVKGMNELLSQTSRGYEFVISDIENVGGNANSGPSKSYNKQFTTAERIEFENDAEKDAQQYGWEENSINIYVNNNTDSNSTGICSIPSFGREYEIIIVDDIFIVRNFLLLHEIGHYFNLCHTQGCRAGTCESKDDEIYDTIKDADCWDLNNIAKNNFEKNYILLNSNQKQDVDNVAYNIMSYHNQKPIQSDLYILTEGQMNVWCDAIDDGNRKDVRNGETWFCDGDRKLSVQTGLLYTGSTSSTAIPNLNDILDDCANNSNIIFYPGKVKGSYLIDKKVTLIATRQGSVTIGAE